MTLFIVEYQAMNDGSCAATNPLGYTDETDCISAFFSKCASAAISSCDTHTVMIVDSQGSQWRDYKHVFSHGHTPEE